MLFDSIILSLLMGFFFGYFADRFYLTKKAAEMLDKFFKKDSTKSD